MPNSDILYLPSVAYGASGALNTGSTQSACCGNGVRMPNPESTKTSDYGPDFAYGGTQVTFLFTTSIPQLPGAGDCNRVISVGCTNAVACDLIVLNPDGSTYDIPLSSASSGQTYPTEPNRTGTTWWTPTSQHPPGGGQGFYQEAGVTQFLVTFTLDFNSNASFTSSSSDPGSWAFIQGNRWGMAVPFNVVSGAILAGELLLIALLAELAAANGTVNSSGNCVPCTGAGLGYQLANALNPPQSMGFGWSLGNSYARVAIESGYLDYYDGTGLFQRWTMVTDNHGNIVTYLPLYANNYTAASPNASGGVTLTFKNRNLATFHPIQNGSSLSGKIDKMIDPNGNPTTYGYDAQGRLISTTDGEGRGNYFAYATSDPNDMQPKYQYQRDPSTSSDINVLHTTTFNYQADGRLSNRVDAEGNTTSFTYNSAGLLSQIFDPRHAPASGIASTTYTYYGSGPNQGKVNTETSYDQQRLTYTYNTKSDNSGTMTILDEDLKNPGVSRTTVNTYDPRRRLIKKLDPLGSTWSYEYKDTLSPYLMTRSIDPNLNVTSYVYDTRGNLMSVTDAKGNTTSYTYDPNFLDQVSTVQTAPVQVWQSGVLSSMIYQPTRFTYDSTTVNSVTGNTTGNLLSVKDPKGNYTRYFYTGRTDGRVTSIQDRNGKMTTMTYTDRTVDTTTNTGNLKSIAFQTGSATTQINYNYDLYDNSTSVTDALGNTLSMTYDNRNRLKKRSNPEIVNDSQDYTLMSYDHDLLGSIELPPNNGSSGSRRLSTMNHDDSGRVSSTTSQVGASATLNQQLRVSYGYDGWSRLTSLGRVQVSTVNHYVFGYDLLDRQTSLNDPVNVAAGKTLISNTYQPYCKSYDQTTARGVRRSYNFDALCQMTQMENSGEKDNYEYDELGRVRTVTQSTSDFSTFGSAKFGQSRFQSTTGQEVRQVTYDELNRVTNIRYVTSNKTSSYQYDSEGNLLQLTDTNGKITVYTYTPDNRLLTVTVQDGAGNPTFNYSYDGAGRLREIAYPTSNALTACYHSSSNTSGWDKNSRLKLLRYSTSSADLQSFSYNYDSSGNRTSRTDSVANSTTNYNYDWLDRLVSASLGGSTNQYTYDWADNRTSKVLPGGTTSYSYDTSDRLTGSYMSDPDGNLTTGVLNGSAASYVWDDQNKLIEVHGPSGALLQQNTYKPEGLRKSKDSNTNYYYSGSTPVSEDGGDTVSFIQGHQILGFRDGMAYYYYVTDALGSVRHVVNSSGSPVYSFIYDEWGNQIGATDNTGGNATLAKQCQLMTWIGAYGVRNEIATTGQFLMGQRWYDPQLGRFISQDPIGFNGGLNLYGYVGQNPVDRSDAQGLRDTSYNPTTNTYFTPSYPSNQGTPADFFMDALGLFALGGMGATALAMLDGLGLLGTAAVGGTAATAGGAAAIGGAPCPELGQIQNALQQSNLLTTQNSMYGPAVMNYVNAIRQGQVLPPILVDSGVLIDGHHRLAAGLITGQLPEIQEINFFGAGGSLGATPVSQITIIFP